MSEKITCKKCDNEACFIKKTLPSSWLNKIEPKKIQIEHLAKDIIFREEGYVHGVYFIKHGHVKVIAKGAEKREQIVRLAVKGHVLGHRGLGDDRYPVSAVACTDTTVCFFDNDTLYDAFMNNPKLILQMMEFYSRELRKTEIRMKYLTQMNVQEKIAEALLYVKQVFGVNKTDGTLNVCFTRQEIANLTGTLAEQVSRMLGDFENKKLIVKKGKGIKLTDEKKLQEIVVKYGIEQYTNQK
jgi:CRP-like cAMP-binding protein